MRLLNARQNNVLREETSIMLTVYHPININVKGCGGWLLRLSVRHLRREESANFVDTGIGHLLRNHERQRTSCGM